MNPSALSNIKVFPSFSHTTFFAGEELTCVLTFKNVAEPSPSSSTTSLEGIKNGNRIFNSKFAGGEWMTEVGRSASDSGRLDLHERSLSTGGKNGEDRSRSKTSQRSHGRSQSVVVSSTPPISPIFRTPNPAQNPKPESMVFICACLTLRCNQWSIATNNRYKTRRFEARETPRSPCANAFSLSASSN
jgi:hypothetical protein